jgi:hypothetical protein
MAHHEVTGKPLLQPRVLGISLAAGLLAELMLTGMVGIGPPGLVVTARAYPADPVQRQVLEVILAEGEHHPVREWLQFLARTIVPDVAQRLEAGGFLIRTRGRGLWHTVRWVPANPNVSFGPLLRIRTALTPDRPLSEFAATLTGLAAACGLGFQITRYITMDGGRSVAEVSGYLKPALRDLIAETQAAVDSALLSHRA